MRELTKSEKVLLSILSIVLIGWGSYQFILVPQAQKLEILAIERIDCEDRVAQMEDIFSRETAINERLEALTEEKNQIISTYFPKLDQAQLTHLLNDLLDKDDIKITDMNFERPIYEEFGEFDVKNMAMSTPYEGSYSGVVAVINAIQSSPRKILIESVSMDRDDEGGLKGDIHLRIYGLDQIVGEEGDVIEIPTEKRNPGKTPFTSYK